MNLHNPFLQITSLIKQYRSPDGETQTILDIPNFQMNRGEQVALEGHSGSGKTTLLNLIAGILQADSGSICLDGEEITLMTESRRDHWRARNIGYVFQTFNLLQGYTALENVELAMRFGRGLDAAYAKHLLERVGLGHRLNYLPRQLSIGQQQRIALARALANHPNLVLADEPTGNLDPHHKIEALELIRSICEEAGAALMLVSHDAQALGYFSRTVSLGSLNRAGAGATEKGGMPS